MEAWGEFVALVYVGVVQGSWGSEVAKYLEEFRRERAFLAVFCKFVTSFLQLRFVVLCFGLAAICLNVKQEFMLRNLYKS